MVSKKRNKKRQGRQQFAIEETKGTLKEFDIIPLKKDGTPGDTTYTVDKAKSEHGVVKYLTSKQEYKPNGNKKGARAPIRVHDNLTQVGNRFPRITPTFKRLK
jgi:hypothetical protein